MNYPSAEYSFMFETQFITNLAYSWLILAGFTFVLLFFVPAPYGRHNRAGWGPTMSALLGWVVMETPAVLVFPLILVASPQRSEPTAWVFVLLWEVHYIHRSWIYPFRRKNTQKRMPILVAFFAVIFNSCNGFLNGAFLFFILPLKESHWFLGVPFWGGLALFVGGMAVNIHSDGVLCNLGKDDRGGYQIPSGGAFRWVSSPNYMGEIVEWFGWTLLTWSLGSLSFAAWTAANLIPRAITNHRWYLDTFPDYPKERKAIIPYVV